MLLKTECKVSAFILYMQVFLQLIGALLLIFLILAYFKQ